jgi:GMP synthase (glutamine-hydrolysing)
MKRILILDAAGDLGPGAAQANIADVGTWFIKASGGDPDGYEAIDVVAGAPPDSLDHRGVIITGSPVSVYEQYDWLDRLLLYTRRALDAGLPMLGVCFGHQVIAHVLGGEVAKNPAGWELGLTEVHLTGGGRGDPLFADLPDPMPVLQMHQDAVLRLPSQAKTLARNRDTECQAFAVGDCVRAVQFHPEHTPPIQQWILNSRVLRLAEQGVNIGPIISELRPTPQARQVLHNFRKHFCGM